MKKTNIVISYIIVLLIVFASLADFGSYSFLSGKSNTNNQLITKPGDLLDSGYELIDGVCYLVIYEEDGSKTILYPVKTEDCN